MPVILRPLLRDKWLLLINIIGATAYLLVSSSRWIAPELSGDPEIDRSVDTFVWLGSALPFLLLISIGNLAWLGLQLNRDAKRTGGRGAWWPVLTALIGGWTIVHVINAHFVG